MTHIALVDRNAGLVHFCGEASSGDDALAKLQADIGGEVGTIDDWQVFKLTAAEAAEVNAWARDGSTSSNTPECLR